MNREDAEMLHRIDRSLTACEEMRAGITVQLFVINHKYGELNLQAPDYPAQAAELVFDELQVELFAAKVGAAEDESYQGLATMQRYLAQVGSE